MPIVALLLFLISISCHAQPGASVKFSALRVRAERDVDQPSAWVIANAEQWRKFAAEVEASPADPPPVDFDKQTVVAIFAGTKPTGGYSVKVTKVTDQSRPGKPSTAVVDYEVISPPPDAMVTQALTYPYVVVRIEKRLEQIEFRPPIRNVIRQVPK